MKRLIHEGGMYQSAGFGVLGAFCVFVIYLLALLSRQLWGIRLPIEGVWWLVTAAGVFCLGFLGCELHRRGIAERQTGLESIGCLRLTSEENQWFCEQIQGLFAAGLSQIDPLAKYVIREGTTLYFADVTEVVRRGSGDDSGEYRSSTVCLVQNRGLVLPVFELNPVSNPLRVAGRLLRLTLQPADCRKFENLYDIDPATDDRLPPEVWVSVKQWLAHVSYGDRYPAWTLRANGGHVLLYRQGKVFSVREFNGLLAGLLVFADIFSVEQSTSSEPEHSGIDLEKTVQRFPFGKAAFSAESYRSVLSQSPPRQLEREWKKLTAVHAFRLVLYVLFSVLAAGLVVGELAVSPVVSAVVFMGIVSAISGFAFVRHVSRPRRARRLLELGTLVYGQITGFAPTGNYSSDRMEYRIDVQFKIDDKPQTARCHLLFSSLHRGAADSLVNSNRQMAILYDECAPDRILLPQLFVFTR
ncbi:MAG: hypothetical protein MK110_00135 [Fuerstiella sp.]|nr:hypothetical protein [Fuerstiella sp.]